MFCRDDKETNEKLALAKQHVVSFNEGSEVAQSIDAAAYVECSAKTKDGVREVFKSAARFASGNKKQKQSMFTSLALFYKQVSFQLADSLFDSQRFHSFLVVAAKTLFGIKVFILGCVTFLTFTQKIFTNFFIIIM